MRLDSVRAFKAEVSEEVKAQATFPEARSFYESTEPPMPAGVGLGVALSESGEHLLAIRTDDVVKAVALADRVNGEADIQIITLMKRSTPTYYQGTLRPLECGAQVAMANKGFVGTLGCFVRDAAGVLYVLSNSHVLADEGRVAPGWRIGQPFGTKPVATLTRFVPFSFTAPNLVDCAIARIDATPTMPRWNAALGGDIVGVRAVTPSDLNRPVLKAGRTTGARKGKITAVEVDGVHIGYDSGTLVFNDKVEVSGGLATDFSAAGDSGSLIVDEDGWGLALLDSGGRDSTGEDRTYGARLTTTLEALGVTLAL